jgi:hypothetical protein
MEMRVWVVQKSEKFQVVTLAVGVLGVGVKFTRAGVRRKSMSPHSLMTPMTLMTLMTLVTPMTLMTLMTLVTPMTLMTLMTLVTPMTLMTLMTLVTLMTLMTLMTLSMTMTIVRSSEFRNPAGGPDGLLDPMNTGILSLLIIPKSQSRAEEERRVRNLFLFVVIVQISNLQTVSFLLTRNSMNLLLCHQVQLRRVNLDSTAHPKIGMSRVQSQSRVWTDVTVPV